jgi:hypothetical protein
MKIRSEEPEKAVVALRVWAHPRRRAECNEEAIKEIKELGEEEAKEALWEMKNRRMFIKESSFGGRHIED